MPPVPPPAATDNVLPAPADNSDRPPRTVYVQRRSVRPIRFHPLHQTVSLSGRHRFNPTFRSYPRQIRNPRAYWAVVRRNRAYRGRY